MKRMAFYFISAFSDGDFVVDGPFTSWGECNMHREGRFTLPHETARKPGSKVAFSVCFEQAVVDAEAERTP